MSAPPYMAYYPRDYRAKTAHLSTLQHGAYHLLIDICWLNEGSLPDDDAQLARIAGLTLGDWRKMRPVIAAFFKIADGFWRHDRVDFELEKSAKLIVARRKASKKANAVRWKDKRKRILRHGSVSDPESELRDSGVSGKGDVEGRGIDKTPDLDSNPGATVIEFPHPNVGEGMT